MSGLERPEQALGPLRRKDGDPVFDEPWQAQALAMADELVRAGVFSAADWAQALGAELQHRHGAGTPDTSETYYRAVLSALEQLLDKGGAVSSRDLSARRDAWERAYLSTPHGRPITLDRG